MRSARANQYAFPLVMLHDYIRLALETNASLRRLSATLQNM